MKPLICPQCGGKITEYRPWENFAVCGYCETKFVISPEKPKPIPEPPPVVEPVYQPFDSSPTNQNVFVIVIGAILLFIFGIFFLAAVTGRKSSTVNYSTRNAPVYTAPTPFPFASPAPKNDLNLLDFGGTGSSVGNFVDGRAIAVDAKGRIYVGDNSLRVQQFDEKGNFLKQWQIHSQTENYRRAHRINKIAVAADERVYIAVGGVILVYKQNSETAQTIQFAPDYIVDFALRGDGGVVAVSTDDKIETLSLITKSNKIARRIKGFQTAAADASMSPLSTGLDAMRLAVDGAGNIFSIYALGDLGSYELSYNEEDFRIFRFTPEGKFVDKFARSMNSVGIAVDNQSRVYVSEGTNIGVYSKNGEPIASVSDLYGIDGFALDRQNNVYIVYKDRVIKRAAVLQ